MGEVVLELINTQKLSREVLSARSWDTQTLSYEELLANFRKKLLGLVERLKETKGIKIFKRGFKKAVEMLHKYEEKEVFIWAPQLKHWLRDPTISSDSGRCGE